LIQGVNITDGDYIEYDSTKATSDSAINTCCKPKKCSEVSYECPSDKSLKNPQPNEDVSDVNCCEPKTCANTPEFTCEEWSEKKPNQPNDPISQENCCQGKLCTDSAIGWTNGKCKNKDYTRASHRGKLKPGARVSAVNQHPNSSDTAQDTGGDIACCEQDLTNNYARMCVGEEYHNGIRTNYSSGAYLPQTIIDDGSRVQISATECKTACDNDDDCGSFSVYGNDGRSNVGTEANPRCHKHRKWPDGSDIPNMVASEYHVRPTYLHYVTGANFPEEHRYSGGKRHTSKTRLTAPADNDATKLNRNDEGGDQFPGVRNWDGNGYKRNNATSLANKWKGDYSKRKDILLAGVDKDYCPVDNVKAYGTHRKDNDYNDWGTWHPSGGANPGLHQAGNVGLFPWASGVGADGNGRNRAGCTTLPVNNALDDCYRNLRCGGNWIGPASGQTDDHSSRIAGQVIVNLTESRRVCPKRNTVKSDNEWPAHKTVGGAFVHPTRIYTTSGATDCSTSDTANCVGNPTDTVRYGVMQPKAAKSKHHYWDGTLLPGDSWNNMNVNTSH
tara:strand:+ start:3321 stop:4991 length:1671 start_codon:yes stop_codon:yes gene_type:complete